MVGGHGFRGGSMYRNSKSTGNSSFSPMYLEVNMGDRISRVTIHCSVGRRPQGFLLKLQLVTYWNYPHIVL